MGIEINLISILYQIKKYLGIKYHKNVLRQENANLTLANLGTRINFLQLTIISDSNSILSC